MSGTDRLKEISDRAALLHRHLLNPRVLAGVLPHKTALLPYRSATARARSREEAFARVSSAYSVTAADLSELKAMRAVELLGLSWSVPLAEPENEDSIREYLGKQDFPWRAITQTRELAVGEIMLDIGANTGRMSIPRVILGDMEAAYCAEPDPLNYACLVRNVRDNHLRGLVLPDQVAIGSVDDVVRLERRGSSGGHRVLDAKRRSKRETVDVTCLKLDTWVGRLGVDERSIAFIKIDVQGSELHVLRGAERLLAHRHIAWQLEIDPTLLRRRRSPVEELLSVLASSFTHFIDLRRDAPGRRVRPIGELATALRYVTKAEDRTDILTFNMAS